MAWSQDTSVPRFGMGTYGNLGYGSSGVTGVPGATILLGDFPIGIHLGTSQGVYESALNLDWHFWNQQFAGSTLGWFAGAGIYGGYGTDFADFQVAGAGGRGLLGVRNVFFKAWEAYVAMTPSYGVNYFSNILYPHWSVDFETGLRFLFPVSTNPVKVVEAPHPQVLLVPMLNAFTPGLKGPMGTLNLSLRPLAIDRVKSWKLLVADAAGAELYAARGEGSPPATLPWNGLVKDKPAPEGSYRATISVTYTDGQLAEVASKPFAIDMSVPEVVAAPVKPRFNPNQDAGDSFQLDVAAKSSAELTKWSFAVADESGAEFYAQEGTGTPPSTLEWNGVGGAGAIAGQGKNYTYTVGVTDSMGKSQSSQGVIAVDFVHPALSLTADRLAFSPVGDPQQVLLTVSPGEIQAVTGWKLQILDAKGENVREFSGKGAVPASLVWDGTNGLSLPVEGSMSAKLLVSYTFDENGAVESAPFEVSTTGPKLSVALAAKHFLPGGDGQNELQTLQLGASSKFDLTRWNLAVNRPDGTTLRTWSGEGQPPTEVAFNGKGDDGTTLVAFGADAAWVYQATDVLGQKSTLKGLLPVDLPRPAVTLSAPAAFSPLGTTKVLPVAQEPATLTRVKTWLFSVLNKEGTVVYQLPGQGSPAALTWDGRNRSAQVVEGSYTAKLDVVYDRGEVGSAVSQPFLLDNSVPKLTASRPDAPWTPDGDGYDDAWGLTTKVTNLSPVASWELVVTDPTGQPFRTLKVASALPELVPWDGKSDSGESVSSAETYSWKLSVVDTLGKAASASGKVTTDILALPGPGGLRLDLTGLTFVPNKATLVSDASEGGKKNAELLSKLNTVLDRLADYKITIVGHAINLSGTAKEEVELGVLSTARAEAVKAMLVSKGLPAQRITAAGKGGTDQVVPDTDKVNRWKNRRVEFLLTK